MDFFMTFEELSGYFNKIEQTSSRLEMTNILSNLFKKINHDEIDKVLYLLQGRVAPLYQKVDFGIAEKMLIKAIVYALSIEKRFFIERYRLIGDLGKTVEEFRQKISTLEQKKLSVSEVFEVLKKISASSGQGSQEVKVSYISQLIRTLDPLSCRYLVRIPVNTLRLGFSDMTILDAFSWMLADNKSLRGEIEAAYHVKPDLGLIGKILKQKGVSALKHIKPEVFTPILMMRAERLSSAEEIIEKIGRCSVEAKYDGFRLQIHYKNHQVKLYSRNLEDVSFMYPDLVEGIKEQAKVKEIIFEGEAVGLNAKTGEFLPFQETVQRKRKYDILEKAKEIPLKLFVFDVLYIEGQDLLKTPFNKRRQILAKSFKTGKTVIIAEDKIIEKPKELELFFEKAIGKGLEGVIAKKLDGVYKAGAREWNWIKYKKSYSSKLTDTIDCLIMGYDAGKGKRTDFGIGAFLVGVYDEKKDQFATVSKIGTGLTDEEWKSLKQKINQPALRSLEKPSLYEVDKNLECDFWVKPAVVVEIRADEITKSPIHTAGRVMKATKTGKGEEVDIPGYALRFPRLEKFRNDKRPEETTTLKEIEKIYKQQLKS